MSPLSPLRCALGVFVALALAGAASAQSEAQPRLDTVTLHAGMHSTRAEVARTPLQRQTGMMFRKAMAQLLNQETNAIKVIKWKGVYENLEFATDRCEDVANIVEGILLEHA